MVIENQMLDTDQAVFANDLRAYAESLGAELYGVASAARYAEAFPDKPGPSRFLDGARSVVVIGMPYEPGTVSSVLRPELSGLRRKASDDVGARGGVQPQGAERFFLGEEDALLTRELTQMAYRLAKYLRHHDWHAFYLPVAKQNGRFRTAPFYHMPAMYLAGLGTLGLNCCVLTPEFGPRIKVTSLITDCPLPTGEPMTEDLCTGCGLCVENCPIGAIDGEGWKNPFACASYGCCGTCMAICPVGNP